MAKDFDWKLTHLALFRVLEVRSGADDTPRLSVEHLGSQKHFETGQELLEEMLHQLLSRAWAKKAGLNETSSCRAFEFRDTRDGESDKQILSLLVAAESLETFEAHAYRLAGRYAGLPRATPGVLVHAVVTVDSGRAKALPFYFLFKCDFEDARTLADERTLMPSTEVLLEKLKKSLMYPYWDGFAQDFDRVKVFQAAGDYFHELLELREPATAKELATLELRSAARARHGNRFDDYFVGQPTGKRELFGSDRVVPLDDLLPPLEVNHLALATSRAMRDKHDAAVKVRIQVDEGVTVTADLAALGKSYFFAQKGGQQFLILRGERFVTAGNLTSLDFLDVEQLEDALPRLDPDVKP